MFRSLPNDQSHGTILTLAVAIASAVILFHFDARIRYPHGRQL
jgi:hypothetical protein